MNLFSFRSILYTREQNKRDFDRSGTIISHRYFPEKPYNRNNDLNIIRSKDLNASVGLRAIVFVKFIL